MNLFISQFADDPAGSAVWMVVVIFSICCHEYAHALTAKLEGDDTAAKLGHLTLNPLKQMGWTSLVMLLVIGIAWGQVPVNQANLRTRRSRVLVSLAGIAANLLLAAASIAAIAAILKFDLTWALTAVDRSQSLSVVNVFYLAALLNIALAIFNLLPAPPLDGFTAFRELFPPLRRLEEGETGRGVMLFVFLAVFAFAGRYLFGAAAWLIEAALKFIGA